MNIGQASQASGLSSKAIRYYEDLGLVVPNRDQHNDYRIYSNTDVERLRFLQRARAAGFSLDECRELLALYADPGQRCAGVKSLVMDKVSQVGRQLAELEGLRETLLQMADECVTPQGVHGASGQQAGKPVAMAFTLLGEADAP